MKKVRGIFIKNDREIEVMREANRIVSQILDSLGKAIEVGIPTLELEEIAQKMCRDFEVKPAFQGYNGFPFAICCSINHEVVHGFPSARLIADGDIVSIDMGVIYDGFYGDSARTWGAGKISSEAQRLIEVTRESLHKGIEQAIPGNNLYDISAAIEDHAVAAGLGVVKRFVGHGIGRALHEKPEVPNFRVPGATGPMLLAGMVLAIEPMLTLGSAEVKVLSDDWTAVTVDGSLAAHVEHTIAIMPGGPQILSLS